MSSRKKLQLGSAGESHDESKASVGVECGSQTDDDDDEEDVGIYEVERVIDMKHIHDDDGRTITKYRVRWKGFCPIDDTWEPLDNFTDLCLPVVQEFRRKYKKMKAKVLEESSTSHVDILSDEIDQIINRRTDVSMKHPAVYYLIRWKGYNPSANTWEHEAELVHAQKVIDVYNCRRKKNLPRKINSHSKAAYNVEEIESSDHHSVSKQKNSISEFSTKHRSKGSSHKSSKLRDTQKEKIDEDNRHRKQRLAHKINKSIKAAQIIKATVSSNHNRESKQKNRITERPREYSKRCSEKSSKLKSSQKEKQVNRSSQENISCVVQEELLHTEDLQGTGYIDKFLVDVQVHSSSQGNCSSEEQVETLVTENLQATGSIDKEELETEGQEKVEIDTEVDTTVNSFLIDLPEYNPENVKVEIERQTSVVHLYSKDLLSKAIREDDYQRVFSYLRNNQIQSQDLDYTQKFLEAARYGQRDIALLLATRVPDLSSKDEWGDTALCMAARKGDAAFANYLLVMGVPIQEALGRPKNLAEEAGHKFFNVFLNQYAKENCTEISIEV